MTIDKIKAGIRAPWKVWNEFLRICDYPMARILFGINGIKWGENWRLYGIPLIQKHKGSQIIIGTGFSLRSSKWSNPLCPDHPVVLCTWNAGARLIIGDNFAMTGGTICAAEKIVIGNNVNIGANTTVIDTDFHPLNYKQRLLNPENGRTSPITIQDNAFIGMNCIILKGVTIGAGSVVGAGSVITGDVSPGVIVAGNPARVIRNIHENE